MSCPWFGSRRGLSSKGWIGRLGRLSTVTRLYQLAYTLYATDTAPTLRHITEECFKHMNVVRSFATSAPEGKDVEITSEKRTRCLRREVHGGKHSFLNISL